MRNHAPPPRRHSAPLLAALLVSSLAFVATAPPRLDLWTPLTWDQAQHFLDALSVRNALAAGSPGELGHALLAPNLYPPGYASALGVWMTVAGQGALSLLLFRLCTLLACVAALWLCALTLPRKHRPIFQAGSAAALLVTVPVIVLAGTFMVELTAVALALAALAAIASPVASATSARSRVLTIAMLVSATLLTKYNIGLPLLPAAIAVASLRSVRRERREAMILLAATLLALAFFALFLCVQRNGWHNFRDFATNRANSADLPPVRRLLWYLNLYARTCVVRPVLAAILGALALAGIAKGRNALSLAATIYICVALAALSLHPYLLDRNLLAVAAVIAIPVGLGLVATNEALRRLGRRGRMTLAALAAVALALVFVEERIAIASQRETYFRPELSRLAPLSRFVESAFRRVGSCRVIGTFNEFSAGWVRILWLRTHPHGEERLAAEFPYPLSAGRGAMDSQDDPAYTRQVMQWAGDDPEESLLIIGIADGSRWADEDYRRWNCWKRNSARAAAGLATFRALDGLDASEDGLRAEFRARETPDIIYGDGWGAAEAWGRWALARSARLELHPPAGPARLLVVVAPFDGLREPQICRVEADGRTLGAFTVSGAPWRWQQHAVPLPAAEGKRVLTVNLIFASLARAYEGDPLQRALPFALVRVEPAP